MLTVLAVAFALIPAAPALADQGRVGAAAHPGALSARLHHRLYGLVPSAWIGGRHHSRPTASEFARSSLASANNLNYNGGPVMQTNKTYAIYWLPRNLSASQQPSANYQSIINGFLADVAAPSEQNASNDVYAVDTQYYGPSGPSGSPIQNSSSFGAGNVWIDTSTPIPNNCSSEYAFTGVSVQGCVLDSDLQAEVSRALLANPSWSAGSRSLFFVFTPRDVGSCFDQFSGQCAYTYYCAYHSNFTDPNSVSEVLYANQPYTETNGVGAPGVCATGQYPNGDPAGDSTVNVLSHEHNEAITDPLGTAWYDSSGNEIGDKCAWNFGTPLGSNAHGQYNQVVNGHDYYVQQEWSNASAGCALKYGVSAPQPKLALSLPGSFTAGQVQSGTVTLESANGTPQTATSPVTVTVSSTGSGTVNSSPVTIPAGSSSGGFTYNDTKAESTTVTASASGYTSASQTETVAAGSAQTLSVSPNPSPSVPVGGTQTFTVSGVDGYGNPANVSGAGWSASGGTVSPSSGSSTTFTAGNVTGSGFGVTASLSGATPSSVTITITAAPANPIQNGGFETGSFSPGWSASGAYEAVIQSFSCHSGAGPDCAQLGQPTPTNGNSTISQLFTVPSGASTVSFYYSISCPDTVTYDWATATLRDNTVGGSRTILPRTCNRTSARSPWTRVSASVTAGHSYTLTLISHDDNYPVDPTYTLYDDVSVQ